jgi:hypothetical protein
MMRNRFSLRNIPKEAEQLAEAIHRKTNLSESDVCRLALIKGMLVEMANLPPEPDGTVGGLQMTDLAKALRRVLGSAIDLLWEQGEHPYQTLLDGFKQTKTHQAASGGASYQTAPSLKAAVEGSVGDDLDQLGIGIGLSETLEITG